MAQIEQVLKDSLSTRIAPHSGRDSFFNSPNPTPNVEGEEKETYVPPWTEPYIIGVAGASGSGKTSVASSIIKEINTPWTILLSLDNFYKPLTKEESEAAHENNYDFDVPEALDLDLCYECVKSLKEGRKTEIPIYDFATHSRSDRTSTIYGANVIIIEGLYSLHHEKLVSLMNIKIYVDTDLDICLARRLSRDILHRNRDLAGVLRQWNLFVKPNSERFVKPTMRNSDLVVPKGSENTIAIGMLTKHIKKQLVVKSEAHIEKLEKLTGHLELTTKNYPNLIKLERTAQLHGIYSILLNKETKRDEFIFYFDRIATTLINKALEINRFEDIEITTPLDIKFKTVYPADNVISINIIRSGDCFMHSLRKTLPEIVIGKLLIQSDSTTGEPQLHMNALPKVVGTPNTRILLLDAQLITGAAMIMAIQVLVDHGVDPSTITVVTYLATEVGLSRVLRAFNVHVVVAEIGVRSKSQEELWFRRRFIDTKYFGT